MAPDLPFEALHRRLPDLRESLFQPARLSDPARLRALLAGANFRDVTIDTTTREIAFDSFDEFWTGIEQGGGRLVLTAEALIATATR
jgi:hypothetical protein